MFGGNPLSGRNAWEYPEKTLKGMEDIRIPIQDNASLRAAGIICATVANTQPETHTDRQLLTGCTISSASSGNKTFKVKLDTLMVDGITDSKSKD